MLFHNQILMMMMIVMMMSKVLMTITLHLCLWIAWDFHYVPLPLLSLAMPEKTIDYFCFKQLYYDDFETLIITFMWRSPIIVQGTWARIDASPLGLLLSQWREVVLRKAPNAPDTADAAHGHRAALDRRAGRVDQRRRSGLAALWDLWHTCRPTFMGMFLQN